jgi:uncharacterized protein
MDLKHDFNVYLGQLPPPDTTLSEVELLDEDMEVDFIRDSEIDLDEIIKEQIYLSLPMKVLCSDQCRGLCPICGMNLNVSDCHCHREQGHPGFLKLKDLKIE